VTLPPGQGPHVDEALGESRPGVHFAQHFGDLDVGSQRIDLLGKGDRGWALKLVSEGRSYREISHRLGFSKNTVLDIVKRDRAA
jgi:hypothetical protein